MYCHNCGQKLSGQEKFCPHCGAGQADPVRQPEDPSKGRKKVGIGKILLCIIMIPLAILGAMVLFAAFGEEDQEQPVEPTVAQIVEQTLPVETEQPTEEVQVPKDGWYEEGGNRYYFSDGLMFVDLQEIDGELYYFYENGVLAMNEALDFDGYTLEAGRNGQIDAVTYDTIGGEWADEKYRFGYGGTSSVMELYSEMEDCDYCTFYIEADGKHGAKVNGDWKLYIRHNGEWEHVKTVSFAEPSGEFTVRFDTPKTFDAITAHPTVQGNASYSSLYYLMDVHCLF